MSDAERSGRPIVVAKFEIIGKIHDMILADRRLNVLKILEATCISYRSMVSILNEHLNVRTLPTKWVPRFLIIYHKRNCVTTFIQQVISFMFKTKDQWQLLCLIVLGQSRFEEKATALGQEKSTLSR